MRFFLYVLIGLGALILLAGGYLFAEACLRKKEPTSMTREELEKTPYGKFYDIAVTAHQWLQDHHAQEVSITSDDGLRLQGLWVPVENAKGTVLLAHGYRSTKLVDFALAFLYFHDLGLNILVPDQRSHGKSQGRYITFGVKESRDMQGWIRFHNETCGSAPMVLYGMSMGASTMLYLADEPLPDNVKGIIADCGFTSPKEILETVFWRTVHVPAGPILWGAELFARLFAGFSLWEKDTRRVLAKSRLPVLMLHGTGDTYVPYEMTKAGFEACAEPKYLHLVENAGHAASFLKDQQGYSDMILHFLKTYMEGF